MRGGGLINIIGDNLSATSAKRNNEKWMNSKWKTCWKCQKDKDPRGGFLRITAGLHKFICKDCMDAKEKERSTKLEE
jgi:hypothetical protein